MKRTPLALRQLPKYTLGEEIANMVTHIPGTALGLAALPLCILKSNDLSDLLGSILYGACLVVLYAMSSIYHGLRPGMAKKVMQVLDHCTIYLLIAGSYSGVLLCALCKTHPALGWSLLGLEWALTALAATLTAIDLKKYEVFSMICYIGMGWAVIPFWRQTLSTLGGEGFLLLLLGGISYTVGAVLYGLGIKIKWMHSVFHVFVVLGSVLQFLCIYFYAL
jgi:hemolysin III